MDLRERYVKLVHRISVARADRPPPHARGHMHASCMIKIRVDFSRFTRDRAFRDMPPRPLCQCHWITVAESLVRHCALCSGRAAWRHKCGVNGHDSRALLSCSVLIRPHLPRCLPPRAARSETLTRANEHDWMYAGQKWCGATIVPPKRPRGVISGEPRR
jgi:hypothetical protein